MPGGKGPDNRLGGYQKFYSDSEDEEDEYTPSSLLVEMKPYSKTHITSPSTSPGHAAGGFDRRSGQNPASSSSFTRNIPYYTYGCSESPKEVEMDGSPQSQTYWRNRQIALDDWSHLSNLDRFLEQVYEYYHGKGLYAIILDRTLRLASYGFIVFFFIFLITCVDYEAMFRHSEVHKSFWTFVDLSNFANSLFYGCCLFLFSVFWLWQAFRLAVNIPEILQVHRFYEYLLHIPDKDIPTISLQEVIQRVVKLHEQHPTFVERLNAHDICNRIMRRENYLIALFNKDILDLIVPLPFFSKRQRLTQTLEYALSFCIHDYVFDENYNVRKPFIKDFQRDQLALELRKRFAIMGIAIFLLSPFIVAFLFVYFIFRYGEEFYKSPKSIGLRQYTPFARWKFREFNELPHFFDQRLNKSYRAAKKYMNQYPNELLSIIAKFVAFVFGSITFVMIVIGVFSEELLLLLEISANRTMIWYIGVFGVLLAISRSLVRDETLLYDPAVLLSEVVETTYYLPSHWRHRLHTDRVRKEFASLFQYRVVVFLEELASVLLSPFILWMALPPRSEQIVDFFREFTVHVHGLGHVCSFAVFDFKRHGNPKYGADVGEQAVDKHQQSKQGKMEKSFLHFKENNPEWKPDASGSMYLARLKEFEDETILEEEEEATEERMQASTSLDRPGRAMNRSILLHVPGIYHQPGATTNPQTASTMMQQTYRGGGPHASMMAGSSLGASTLMRSSVAGHHLAGLGRLSSESGHQPSSHPSLIRLLNKYYDRSSQQQPPSTGYP